MLDHAIALACGSASISSTRYPSRAGGGEIDGDGRLADAALLIENADNHRDAFLCDGRPPNRRALLRRTIFLTKLDVRQESSGRTADSTF
jgi:hypothetical protein